MPGMVRGSRLWPRPLRRAESGEMPGNNRIGIIHTDNIMYYTVWADLVSPRRQEVDAVAAARHRGLGGGAGAGGDELAAWAERTGRQGEAGPGGGGLRFAFYGRVSTEDYQDPVTSLARQLGQAGALVAGHGQIVAQFFDIGQSRVLAWASRPQAAA